MKLIYKSLIFFVLSMICFLYGFYIFISIAHQSDQDPIYSVLLMGIGIVLFEGFCYYTEQIKDIENFKEEYK